MSKNAIVIVSHSSKIGEGLIDLISEMIQDNSLVSLVSASGTEDDRIGTSATKIMEEFEKLEDHENILVFYDIGSSKMSSEMAIELSGLDNVILIEAPLVEGAFAGAVTASVTTDLETILNEIQNSKNQLLGDNLYNLVSEEYTSWLVNAFIVIYR